MSTPTLPMWDAVDSVRPFHDTRLHCHECTIDDDPAPWCDCTPDERCSGTCRRRAHHPDRCPRVQPAEAPDDDAVDTAWHAGYAEGKAAGLAARPDTDVYVPVPTRWRYIAEGDTFVGGSSLWHVQARRDVRGAVAVTAVCGARRFDVDDLDPDEAVTVLLSVSERDAVAVAAEVLGGRVAGREGTPP